MSKVENIVRLRHMLDAAQKAIEFTRGCSSNDFEKDDKLTLSVVRLLEILGEAAKNVSEQYKNEHLEIPWRQIAGTRDKLIHGYFDVDLDIVWKIVLEDLPPLVTQLEKAMANN